MSVQATTWVWEHSLAAGTDRLVLLAVADAANREGEGSWQSVETLARMARVSPRTVQRALKSLEALGELEATGTHGRYQTRVYRLSRMGQPVDNPVDNTVDKRGTNLGDRLSPVTPVTRRGDTGDALGVTPVSPKPKENPIEPIERAPDGAHTHAVPVDNPEQGVLVPAPSQRRGTRLPENWVPEADTIRAQLDQYPHLDLRLELEKFRDYWAAIPGQRGTKLDWTATWRNWIRRAAENAPRGTPAVRRETLASPRPGLRVQAEPDPEWEAQVLERHQAAWERDRARRAAPGAVRPHGARTAPQGGGPA